MQMAVPRRSRLVQAAAAPSAVNWSRRRASSPGPSLETATSRSRAGRGSRASSCARGWWTKVTIHLVPALLGGGVRLFDGNGIATLGLEQVRVIEAPGVTHLTYRRVG
jgi:hypothetical protein